MEEMIIRYTGHTASPSDYDCKDGELSVSMDLWSENGALKPVLQPQQVLQCNEGDNVVCVHQTTTFKHFIVQTSQGKLIYANEGTDSFLPISNVVGQYTASTMHRITAIGNMLVVLTTHGMDYYLWKDNAYKSLGSHLPEINLSFGLQGEAVVTEEEFDITLENELTREEIDNEEFSDENKRTISSQVHAKINKFIADRGTNNGKFIFPFFIRYAYRLYDGTLAMHSSPILMMCTTGPGPIIISDTVPSKGMKKFSNARVLGVAHQIVMQGMSNDTIALLETWKDIITSIDVFVSAPIYTYNQNKEVDYFGDLTPNGFPMVCINGNPRTDKSWAERYQLRSLYEMYRDSEIENERGINTILSVPKDEESVFDKIKACANFYLLKSYNIDSGMEAARVIEVSDDYLQSLVARESMEDDYDSHDKLIPEYAFAYNQRLNIATLKKELFKGFRPKSVMQYTDGFVDFFSENLPSYDNRKANVRFFVHLNIDGTEYVLQDSIEYTETMFNNPLLYYYYPNINAYKLTVEWVCADTNGNIGTYYFCVPLTKHDFLNGAYYFSDWNGAVNGNYYKIDSVVINPFTPIGWTSTGNQPSATSDNIIDIKNKIYTSNINNPIYFPLLGINTVGVGTILGIAAATKALSQGQYRQFPLYAFSTDGVWSLEVSSTGSYSAKQPVTRDVCTDKDSITQLDNAILFVTEKGIMLLIGSDTKCITEEIDNLNGEVFNPTELPGYNLFTGETEQQREPFMMVSFREYMAGCRMIYDDTSRRLIVFNSKYRYAYVYSMITQLWAMMRSNIASYVLSYPEAYAMTTDYKLMDYSKRIPNTVIDGHSEKMQVIVTRPLKLGYPDMLKTPVVMMQRGVFKSGHVQTLLYGSRDMMTWFPVYSSKDHSLRGYSGTPYKYFRIVLICHLTDSESISGTTVEMIQKLSNRMR